MFDPKQNGVATRALELVGTPFKLHGRSPQYGLDCVGLVAECLRNVGIKIDPLPRYFLRGDYSQIAARFLCEPDFVLIENEGAEPGDIILVQIAADRQHFQVITRAGLVHAHAGLGRIVLSPTEPEWPILRRWRWRT